DQCRATCLVCGLRPGRSPADRHCRHGAELARGFGSRCANRSPHSRRLPECATGKLLAVPRLVAKRVCAVDHCRGRHRRWLMDAERQVENMSQIVQCVSCDGYGWIDDEGKAVDCDWCAGIGYVYRNERGLVRRIPTADLPYVSEELEALEAQRLRQLGYTGEARKPWEQAIRRQRSNSNDS